jgi:hypothetical protein
MYSSLRNRFRAAGFWAAHPAAIVLEPESRRQARLSGVIDQKAN